MEDIKLKAAEKVKDTEVEEKSSSVRSEGTDNNSKPKSSNMKSATVDKDLDVFLLGDLEDSDDGPGTICIVFNFFIMQSLFIQADFILFNSSPFVCTISSCLSQLSDFISF